MITLYLRKYLDGVAAYNAKEDSNSIAFWPSYLSNKPTKRNKYVMLNCYKYRIEWI